MVHCVMVNHEAVIRSSSASDKKSGCGREKKRDFSVNMTQVSQEEVAKVATLKKKYQPAACGITSSTHTFMRNFAIVGREEEGEDDDDAEKKVEKGREGMESIIRKSNGKQVRLKKILKRSITRGFDTF